MAGAKETCGTCSMFNPAVDRCSIHGPSVVVVEEMTCDYYEKGRPHRQKLRKVVTPKESNLRDSRGSTS